MADFHTLLAAFLQATNITNIAVLQVPQFKNIKSATI